MCRNEAGLVRNAQLLVGWGVVLRLEDCKFKTCLGYRVRRSSALGFHSRNKQIMKIKTS